MTTSWPGANVTVSLTGKSSLGISPSMISMRALGTRLMARLTSTEMMRMVSAIGLPLLLMVSFSTSLVLSWGESAMISDQRWKAEHQTRLEIAEIGEIVDPRNLTVIRRVVIDTAAQ